MPEFIAFTDEDALNAWSKARVDYAEMSARELCSVVVSHGGDGLLLNPAGPAGGKLGQRDVEMLADGLLPNVNGSLQAEAGAPIEFWRPQPEPEPATAQSIRTALRDVGIAWCLVLDCSFGGLARHRLLAFHPDTVSSGAGVECFGEILQRTLAPGEMLDIVVLSGEQAEGACQLGIRIDA
jgi:hypothetical protein